MPRWRACAPRTNSPPQPEADTLVELRPALAKLAPLVHELKQRAELDVERATAAEAAAAADASKSAQLREQVAQAAADLGAKQASLERERGARGDVDAHTHELAGELEETKVNLGIIARARASAESRVSEVRARARPRPLSPRERALRA